MEKKGATLDHKSREIVFKIINTFNLYFRIIVYFMMEMMRRPLTSLRKVTERVAAATGVSERTISRLKKEAETADPNDGTSTKPENRMTNCFQCRKL